MIISSKLVAVPKSSAQTEASGLRVGSWPLAAGTSGAQPTLGAGSLPGPQQQQREGLAGSGEDGIMPPFSGSWQSLPGPGLLNAHWSHTLDSVSQAALCQGRNHPERRSLSSLLTKAKASKRASAAGGADFLQEIEAWEPQSWEGKCVTPL